MIFPLLASLPREVAGYLHIAYVQTIKANLFLARLAGWDILGQLLRAVASLCDIPSRMTRENSLADLRAVHVLRISDQMVYHLPGLYVAAYVAMCGISQHDHQTAQPRLSAAKSRKTLANSVTSSFESYGPICPGNI